MGLAVERAPLSEDLVPLREESRDLDRVLVRLAAAGGEDRLREVTGRDLGEQTGEGGAALLAEPRRHVAGALGLLLDRADHLGMPVPEIDVDEPRREVEDPPVAGVEPGALGAGDDDLFDAALRGPRHENVVGGVLRDRRRVGGSFRRDGHRRRV